MGIHYKFASAKEFNLLPIDGLFISVAAFKRGIYESHYRSTKKSDSNGLCLGTDLDFTIINSQTNQQYDDDDNTLIPNHTTLLLRRVPGSRRFKPIDTSTIAFLEPQLPLSSAATASGTTQSTVTTSSSSNDRFENLVETDDEDSKIRALVNTPALDWQGRSYGRMGGAMENRTPPEGYVCHRCNVAGHFIRHCPTNGDPHYDFKLRKPVAAPLLLQNETAFDELFQCAPPKRSSPDVPPELLCPFCRKIMRDAVLTSKCCFSSFCAKCITDHLMSSKLKCVCGANQVLVDSLIPNITLRETINRFSYGGSSENSASNAASSVVVSANDSSKKETEASLESAARQSPQVTTEEEVQKVVTATEEEGRLKRIASDEKVVPSDRRKRKKNRHEYDASYSYNAYPYVANMQECYYYGEGCGFNYASFGMPYRGVMPHHY